MIQLKNSVQLKDMRDAGRITAQALLVAEEAIREGVSTYEVDAKIRTFIKSAVQSPLSSDSTDSPEALVSVLTIRLSTVFLQKR